MNLEAHGEEGVSLHVKKELLHCPLFDVDRSKKWTDGKRTRTHMRGLFDDIVKRDWITVKRWRMVDW